MAQFVEKGDEHVAKAEKKLKSFSLFGNKNDDALDLYVKAGNFYKQGQAWQKAGETFRRISELHVKMGSQFEAAQSLIDASNAFKKCSPHDAISALKSAIEIYLEMGRFTTAAKNHKEIAELYETEGELKEAADNFEAAAKYFQTEEATTSANQCLLKVASLSADLENFERAVEVYEQVANASLDVALLKYSVKDYYFNAGLCLLALGNTVQAKRSLDTYNDKDVNFPDSNESKLLASLIQAVDDRDSEAFTQAVFDFDQTKKLDKWRTSILLKVKKSLASADGGIL